VGAITVRNLPDEVHGGLRLLAEARQVSVESLVRVVLAEAVRRENDEAGPPAPADIRETVNAEQKLDVPQRGLTERLMFWKASPKPGTLLDPSAESQRLRENAALGQSPTVGQSPIIQDKKPDHGWLGIF